MFLRKKTSDEKKSETIAWKFYCEIFVDLQQKTSNTIQNSCFLPGLNEWKSRFTSSKSSSGCLNCKGQLKVTFT